MATHEHKRSRREPLSRSEVLNASPMAISPASGVTPSRISLGSLPAGAFTPQRGACSQTSAIGVQWGLSSARGPRSHMEDFGVVSAADGDVIFGVYDGHGGTFCSEYCQQQLHSIIRSQGAYPCDLPNAIKHGYLQADELLMHSLDQGDQSGGTCALVAIVTQTSIVVGNAGDCRAVYACGAELLELSRDHVPENEEEARRAQEGRRRSAPAARARALARSPLARPRCLSAHSRARARAALPPLGPPAVDSRRPRAVRLRRAARRSRRAARHARAGRRAHEGTPPAGPLQA
jgi:hypothetical protein